MKFIRKGAPVLVFFAAGTVLALIGMAKPAQTVPVSTEVTNAPSTMSTSENAYCAKGDIWTGATTDGPAELPHGCVHTGLDGTPSPGKVTSVPRVQMSSAR